MSHKIKAENELDHDLASPRDLLSSKQVEKLNLEIQSLSERRSLDITKLDLEIENLRKKNRWETLAPIIPPIVSVVAVVASIVGILIGAGQFKELQQNALRDKSLERSAALEKQLHSDMDELSRFTQDKNQTLSRLSFLIEDLKTIKVSADPMELPADDFHRYERGLTKALVQQIVNEADFMKNPQDVVFANTIAASWGDYHEYLVDSKDPEILKAILYNYVRVLRYLHEHNAAYFKVLEYDEESQGYTLPPSYESFEGEEILFQHFKQCVEGFKIHFDLLDDLSQHATDEAKRNKASDLKLKSVRDFGDAVCIASVAQHVLGGQFKSKRPCMLRST
jgi:hypothetical protein